MQLFYYNNYVNKLKLQASSMFYCINFVLENKQLSLIISFSKQI